MTIKLLSNNDKVQLEAYLAPHKAEAMFICSNLKGAGIEYHGENFQGHYYGYFDDYSGELKGVIVHYWNGNIMMYASEEPILQHLTIHLKEVTKRPIGGILGLNSLAEKVIQWLGLADMKYNINSNEGLYELGLEELEPQNLLDGFEVVEAAEVAKDLLIKWREDYEIEALGSAKDEAMQKRAEEAVANFQKGDCWVLKQDDAPVSLCGFNARLEDIVQIGPVWTPPAFRNQGFAKNIVSQTLVYAKKQGVKKAILFTDNPPAIRAYEAIGFKKIDHFRLAILTKTVTL